jgi:hypothetical protein
MKFLVRVGTAASIALWLTGCEAAVVPTASDDDAETTSPFVVSEPTSTVAAGVSLALATSVGPQTYVAMAPGSAPSGVTAVITNSRRNASVTAFMFGGGFDPASIAGETGDTLRVVVRGISGEQLLAASAVVPARRRPTVLRTSPPPRKRDVPLNALINVVFSEPMDSRTLTAGRIQMLRGNQPVPGEIQIDASGTQIEFRPQTLLDANTVYTISLQGGITDASSDPLDAVSFEFTTSDGSTTGMSELAVAGCAMDPQGVERCGLYVVTADGSRLSALTSSEGLGEWDSSPAWSPDARRIAFSSWRHCIAESRAAPPNGGNCPRELYVMNADGSGIQRITNMDTTGGFAASFPAWSPDGTQIAFIADRFGADRASTIRLVKPDGTGQRVVRESPDIGFGRVSWSPDGAWMAFSGANTQLSYSGILVMSVDGSGIEKITAGYDGFPSWSRDGSRIAFQRRYAVTEDGVTQTWHHIHVVDPSGANDIQLTQGVGTSALFNLTPTWSPDGTRIAYIRTTSPRQLRIMTPDGTHVTSLTGWSQISLPAWSPVGTVPE